MMVRQSKTFALLVVLLLSGCAATSPSSGGLLEVRGEEGADCRELGAVSGRATGQTQDRLNERRAMDLAKDSARERGANAYRVLDADQGGYGTQVVLMALDC